MDHSSAAELTFRMPADGAEFTEIDHGGFKTFVTDEIGNRVGDETLRYAIECDTHAGTRKCDASGAGLDIAEVDRFASDFGGAPRNIVNDIALTDPSGSVINFHSIAVKP